MPSSVPPCSSSVQEKKLNIIIMRYDKWIIIHGRTWIWNFSLSFNLMAHKWAQRTSKIEIWTQEEKFHISLQATIYYFVYYKHNRPLLTSWLYWWMKRIGSTIPEKKSLGALAIRFKMKKMCWIVTKTNSGRNFQFAKFSDSDFFLSNRKNIFRYTNKIILWQIFQFLIFILSRKICHCQSHWVHNFWFFFLYFGFLPLLGKFWTSLSVRGVNFSVS